MACFIVPAAEAVAATAVTKITEKKEQKETPQISIEMSDRQAEKRTPFSKKLKWLDTMLWGGSALLLLEHIWHREVTWYFPFFTAAETPEGLAEMLTEMRTVGVAMAALVTLVWAGMVILSAVYEKRTVSAPNLSGTGKWNLKTLDLIYGGTLLMAVVDAAFSLQKTGVYTLFHPTAQVLYSNIGLGLCAAILGLLIWAATELVQNNNVKEE